MKRTRMLAGGYAHRLRRGEGGARLLRRAVGRGAVGPASRSVSAAPLDVTEMLREKLFDRVPTIATSATLAVGGDFSFFCSRVGLTARAGGDAALRLRLSRARAALRSAHASRAGLRRGQGPYLDELAEQMG